MLDAPERQAPAYNGLAELTPGLPADAYYDPRRYELELKRIWYKNWVYVCRSSELAGAKAYRTFELGDQRILLVRDETQTLHGFHNTCRHRGSVLCTEPKGTLRSSSIVCPYHAWVYNLRGELLRTTSKRHGEGFKVADFTLYKIRVREWNGFVFVALTADPPSFDRLFDTPLNRLDAWPLAELEVGHTLVKTIECNWKIFWENFNECLHCPGVHPKLSSLVPIYGRALMDERDDPNWSAHAADPDPKYRGGMRAGADTWSLDGQLSCAPFPDLSEEDRKAGYVYMTGVPSIFIVGHPDYVRVVRVRPLGPERTELTAEYLFAPQTLADPKFDLRSIVEFTSMVLSEDGGVCELNQRGLRAQPHVRGVVMPEEYVIRQFHDWVNSELARA